MPKPIYNVALRENIEAQYTCIKLAFLIPGTDCAVFDRWYLFYLVANFEHVVQNFTSDTTDVCNILTHTSNAKSS